MRTNRFTQKARPVFWWGLLSVFLVALVVGDYRHPSALPMASVGFTDIALIGLFVVPFVLLWAIVRIIRHAWTGK